MTNRAFSLRDVPWVLYLVLGLDLVCSLISFAAVAGKEGSDGFDALQRWDLLTTAASTTYLLLLPLGMLELAHRQVGTARGLAIAVAVLSFVQLIWMLVPIAIAVIKPDVEHYRAIYTWTGRILGVANLAAAILLTLAADAWRRVPLAAIGLLLLHVTSSWVPVIGDAIRDALFDERQSLTPSFAYRLLRDGIAAPSVLFLAAALAARGRVIESHAHAYRGLQLAKGALIARLICALAFAMIAFVSASGLGKYLTVAAPGATVITAVLFAIGLQQIASAHVTGLSRVLFALGAVCVVWGTAVQLEHALASLHDTELLDTGRKLGAYAVIAPIVTTVGMLLAGIGINLYATRVGDHLLSQVATVRLVVFVLLMLASVVIAFIPVKTSGGTVMLLLAIAAANVGALIAYVGMLGSAAIAMMRPSIPPARVV